MKGKISPVVIVVTVLVLLLAMIGVYGYVLTRGGDVDKLTGFLLAAILPTVTTLLLLLKTEALDEKMTQVQQQTNGNMTKLIDHAVTSVPGEPLPGTVPAQKERTNNGAD